MQNHSKNPVFLRRSAPFFIGAMCFLASAQAIALPDLALSGDVAYDERRAERLAAFSRSDAELTAVSQSVLWRRLLFFYGDNAQSQIDDPAFFLAKDGKSDPKAELVATLQAWQDGDARACNFVARTRFLQQSLGIDAPLPVCADFEAWAKELDANALSFVYADEHPNRLASAFGHAFLRVDGADDKAAKALNYTPDYEGKSGPATAIGSLNGRFFGKMEILDFAEKRNDYNTKDERDLWQYALKLNADQVDSVARHVWETKDLKRPYYLTRDNCASEILRLLDTVDADLNLLAQAGTIHSPAKAAQLLRQADLVRKTRFLPSDATYRQAAQNQKNAAPVIDGASLRSDPTLAPPPRRVGASFSFTKNHTDALSVSFRPAYRDALDPSLGTRQYVDLSAMNVELMYDVEQNDPKIERVDILSHRAYNPRNSQKSYNGVASGLRLGLEQTRAIKNDTDSHLVGYVTLERGGAWTVGEASERNGDLSNAMCYVLASASAQAGRIQKGNRMSLGANMGCLYDSLGKWRARAQVELPYWAHIGGGDRYFAPAVSLGVQYDLNRQNAVRAEFFYQKDDDSRLNIGYYRYF